MDHSNKYAPPKGSDAFHELADLISASSRHGEGTFANIRALQEQKQLNAPAGSNGKPRARVTIESPNAAAARVALQEARARRLAAEAAKAKAEEALTKPKASVMKQMVTLPKDPNTSLSTLRSTALASKPQQPKPRKVSSMFHNLVLGLNVQARTWEAPTKDLIALDQARRSLGNHQAILDKRTRALKAVLDEVRARGGDDADSVKVLRDLLDRKISEEEAERKLKAIEDGKTNEDKGMSLAEKEELARLEIKAQQLILQKLELERREEQRKEVEEIQKRIREKGLPIKLSRPTADPYAAYYRSRPKGDPAAIDDFADAELFDDGGSAAFGLDDEMFGSSRDFALRRAQTLDGRSRGLNEQLQEIDPLPEYGFDDEAMLYDDEALLARRPGQARGGAVHPLQQRSTQPKYETLGKTGLPKFNKGARRDPKRAQSTGLAVNFRIQPNDPRLDPRSPYYKAEWARAFRDQQLREAQQAKLVQQAEAERAYKLELEKKALADERAQALVDAQVHQERKLQEEARAKAAQDAAQRAQDAEILRKRRQLQEVRSMEEILAAEEQLNYLEDLLRSNPRAAIPGFDPRRLLDEPNLLPYVLELVEENIRRPEAARYSAQLLQESIERERAGKEARERLLRQEQELNRLEALLTQHPQATIKGLDISKLNSDPQILQEALRQVEDYIQRGENPLEIPLQAMGEAPLNEARTVRQLSDAERDLVHRFLLAEPEVQVHHLRSLPSHRAQARFLAAAMQEADLSRAQQLVDRFNAYGFNLELPLNASSRPPLVTPSIAAQVPTIIVEQALSPPPTQDTVPAFPFPNMWENMAHEASASEINSKGGKPALEPTYVIIDDHNSDTPQLPSPPVTIPGRTSATHPSAGAVAAAAAARAAAELLERQEAEDALAAQEAELERERQEIIAAEEALLREETEKSLVEAQKRADEEALEALRLQDELRTRAAYEIEEAAQAQAREMAEAEIIAKDAWIGSTPRQAEMESPILAALPTPSVEVETADPAMSANDLWDSPRSEIRKGPTNIEDDPAGGEGTPQNNSVWNSPASKKTASPALSRAGSTKPVSSTNPSPKAHSIASWSLPGKGSSDTASPAAARSPLSTAATTPRPSRAASPAVSRRTGRSPSVRAASPLIPALQSPAAVTVSPQAPALYFKKAASPAQPSANPPSSPAPVSLSHPKPVVEAVSTPIQLHATSPPPTKSPASAVSLVRSGTPKSPTSLGTPKAVTSRLPTSASTPKAISPVVSSKYRTPAIRPGVATPSTASNIATPKATFDTSSGAPLKEASPVALQTPLVADACGSPVVSVKAISSANSPAGLGADAWGSQQVSSLAARSPSLTASKMHDAWGAVSPGTTGTPQPVPAGSPRASPTKSVASKTSTNKAASLGSKLASPGPASPTKSVASKASTNKAASLGSKLASPAFGLAAATRGANGSGQTTPEAIGGPKTAIKGSDPVVVSMAEPVTPYEENLSKPATGDTALPEAYPEEEYEDYSDEGDDGFNPADFPIYMKDEPLDPGYTLAENSNPHPFQERYPKGPGVTEEALFNHFAELAHKHGFHAIYQCEMHDLGDSFVVQGYMVQLRFGKPPSPAVGGPFDIPDKNAGKATVVSDASTPGWS